MIKLHCIFYITMIYFILILAFDNNILTQVNINLYSAITILHSSIKLEHETFKACETGHLKEYRIKKKAELLKSIRGG